MKKILLYSSCLPLCFLQSDEQFLDISTLPWLTGPLIVQQGEVIPRGHFQIEGYLFVGIETGFYDEHWHSHSTPNFYSLNPELFVYVGLTEWMDIFFVPQVFYNITQGESSIHFGDLPINLEFQFLSSDAYTWVPGVKFSLGEVFPTGKYQHLNPKKKGTDISGAGSFITVADLVFYKVFHIKNLHYLSTTLDFEYAVPAPVHVKGLNAYGGGRETKGTVYPGNSFSAIFSFEYTFNEHWVFALDNIYTHTNKDRFSGKRGADLSGNPAKVGDPSSEQISFAPAIEYNFSEHLGIIAGTWFSAFGRNSNVFRNAVVNIVYNY